MLCRGPSAATMLREASHRSDQHCGGEVLPENIEPCLCMTQRAVTGTRGRAAAVTSTQGFGCRPGREPHDSFEGGAACSAQHWGSHGESCCWGRGGPSVAPGRKLSESLACLSAERCHRHLERSACGELPRTAAAGALQHPCPAGHAPRRRCQVVHQADGSVCPPCATLCSTLPGPRIHTKTRVTQLQPH